MERARSFLMSPTYGNLVTVLSIDGGGIRGIIPGTMLSFLESELQVKSYICIDIFLYYNERTTIFTYTSCLLREIKATSIRYLVHSLPCLIGPNKLLDLY